MLFRSIVLIAALCSSLPIRSEVHLANLLSDHAVLQRDRPVHVWGWANPAEKVTVRFHAQTAATRADENGMWETWLSPEQAGGPYTLSVVGDATASPVERMDILMGDVWVASGQSNMEFPLKGSSSAPMNDSDKEIAAANQPNLRILIQKHRSSAVPLNDVESGWMICTPETSKDFSAVAYFFGREISSKEHVPVGLIDSTWGGTPAHAWISGEGIARASLLSVLAESGKLARQQGRADELRALYEDQDAELKAAGKPVPVRGRIPNDRGGSWMPSALYNGMIAPYTKYTIKGAIWYQGEADANPAHAPIYEQVLTALIKDWRRQWAQGEFPFLFVQISSFGNGSEWGLLRDAQRRTLELGETGMAVTLDVGQADNIHPPDKQTVGARLAQTARGLVYGENIETASPMFTQATVEGNSMRAWFSHADGLTTRGQALGGFEVAGDDHKFVPATGIIEKETVLVSAPSVASPKYVRYGWMGTVTNWFYNSSGLPAGSFTSE
jgi:sialate O-acetylesterase